MNRLYIFDLDGTLVDSSQQIYLAVTNTCRDFGIEPLSYSTFFAALVFHLKILFKT
jgi:beta-phosphoglucomutase-like phosphatase (HAD superfamily)